MRKSVYLAGGFRSDWQEKVIKSFSSVVEGIDYDNRIISFYNPKTKTINNDLKVQEKINKIFANSKNYVNWDLQAIDNSEVVFAYIERSNPAVGVMFEIGYAIAKGIKVILVIEENHELFKDRYFDILRERSFYNVTTLEDGILCLDNLLKMF